MTVFGRDANTARKRFGRCRLETRFEKRQRTTQHNGTATTTTVKTPATTTLDMLHTDVVAQHNVTISRLQRTSAEIQTNGHYQSVIVAARPMRISVITLDILNASQYNIVDWLHWSPFLTSNGRVLLTIVTPLPNERITIHVHNFGKCFTFNC